MDLTHKSSRLAYKYEGSFGARTDNNYVDCVDCTQKTMYWSKYEIYTMYNVYQDEVDICVFDDPYGCVQISR